MPTRRQGRRPSPRRRFDAWLLGALAALPVVLLALDADARAGGGEHYSGPRRSGGGGGGFGFSGGGDGGGELAYVLFRLLGWLLQMTFRHPQVMIPVWIGVGVIVFVARKSMPGEATRDEFQRLDRSRLRADPGVHRALTQLRARDPGFDVPRFLERNRRIFLEIQEAWFLRRLDAARAFMSDGLHRRFTTLLALMADEGRRDAIADTRVDSTDIVRVGRSEAFDFITVRIDASLKDVEVPAKTSDAEARRLAERATAQPFTELWTFVRRPDAKTRSGYDLGQGSCPNCGAPFEGGAAGACAYCKAIVNSGAYDWVLAEITQASEFLPHARPVPELAALRARDPDAAAELIEDRALLVFWKWLEARTLGRPEALRKLASARGWDAFQAEIKLDAGGGVAHRLAFPAVGGADLVALELDVDGCDRAHVDVRWSAALRGARHSSRPHRHVVTLVRAAGATTDRGVGLANERCGNCQAPLTQTDSTTCDYCGHDFTSASREWQLEGLTRYEAWRRPSHGGVSPLRPEGELPAMATASERRRLLQLMASVARADGVVDHRELKLLRTAARRWQVPWAAIEGYLEDVSDPLDALDGGAPAPDQVLRSLVAAARVDGRIDRRERALMERAALHLHAEPGTLERLLAA